MFDTLVFAIEAKDEETAISLLNIISRELLFYDAAQWDFYVSLIKHHDCQRVFVHLQTLYPAEVNNAKPIDVNLANFEPALPINRLDVCWNMIYKLSKERKSDTAMATALSIYLKEIQSGNNEPAKYALRGILTSIALQDFPSATLFSQRLATLFINNKTQMTPFMLVDDVLTHLMLCLSGPLQVNLNATYKTLLKNNLFTIKPLFSACYDLLLFENTATINFQTLQAASLALDYFETFDRRKLIVKRDFARNAAYQQGVKDRLFIVSRLVDWLDNIEKQAAVTVTYARVGDLSKLIDSMEDAVLANTANFYRIKVQILKTIADVYSMLGQAENPYQAQQDQAHPVWRIASKRNNEKFYAFMSEPELTPPVSKKNKAVNKKHKRKNKKNGSVTKDETPAKLEIKGDDHKELPPIEPVTIPEEVPAAKEDTSSVATLTKVGVFNKRISPHYFRMNPQDYLKTVYEISTAIILPTSDILAAIYNFKSDIDNFLYKAGDRVLREQCNKFIVRFGKTEASKIFINFGVFGALVDQHIFPLENEVAKPGL